MQLILDADNIDLERNMSTSDQESLNEKLLTNKVIEHLADDITSGNKENIQKQNNIIPDTGHDNTIDTGKEIQASGDDTLTEKSKEDAWIKEDVESSNGIAEQDDVKTDSEQACNEIINETTNKEESRIVESEVKLREVNTSKEIETELVEVKETDLLVNNTVVKDDVTVKQLVNTELPCESKNTVQFNENVNAPEILSESNEENDVELDIKVNIPETLAKSNEENGTNIDKNVNIDETSIESLERNKIQFNRENNDEIEKTVNALKKLIGSDEEKDVELEKLTNVLETSKEDSEIELDKEVDISELSRELSEEAAMDLDKDCEVTDLCTETNNVSIIEVEESISLQDEQSKTESERSSQVPKVNVNVNSKKVEGQETEQNNVPIEIDDECEKTNDICAESNQENKSTQEKTPAKTVPEELAQPKRICRLSNNLDIFSDEEDDNHSNIELPKKDTPTTTEKQCISIDDDDDIMFMDVESSNKSIETNEKICMESLSDQTAPALIDTNQSNSEITTCEESKQISETIEKTLFNEKESKETIEPAKQPSDVSIAETNKVVAEKSEEKPKNTKPLLPKNFVKTCKKNLADMTREDLEEFCVLKIVESIVDRSNLGEIKRQLKNLTQTMDECKNKCLILTKQNKDLQTVLKSVQDEQKNGSDVHITPLKITRSVGMQVMMVADRNNQRKKSINGSLVIPAVNPKQGKAQQTQTTRNLKEKPVVNQQIPVPRLVPATTPAAKVNQTSPAKQTNLNASLLNGLRVQPTMQKGPEKRSRAQAVTVDLTDDEPPSKLANVQRAPLNTAMRVITTAPNLIPAPRFAQNMNSPRKVYIPISGPQAQNVRPGQTIMLKSLTSLGPRPRAQVPPQMVKSPQTPSPVRYGRGQPSRHPAPLPDATRQLHLPTWKALPPAPDLKLSKVENGIVISWKIDGYQEKDHEEIASYQLFAYQETASPPNTSLWKKIGDVKALPLPMACTLTQFMAGYKYYFAVRAVDVRSRFGPFSLPGSILLLNKM